jgi:hypothetical protein
MNGYAQVRTLGPGHMLKVFVSQQIMPAGEIKRAPLLDAVMESLVVLVGFGQ